MTYNALRTQEMLNILISWLRDHTHTRQHYLALKHLSQGRSITNPLPPTHSCHLFLMSSLPFSFSVSIHQVWGFRRSKGQAIPASELSDVAAGAKEEGHQRWTDT